MAGYSRSSQDMGSAWNEASSFTYEGLRLRGGEGRGGEGRRGGEGGEGRGGGEGRRGRGGEEREGRGGEERGGEEREGKGGEERGAGGEGRAALGVGHPSHCSGWWCVS